MNTNKRGQSRASRKESQGHDTRIGGFTGLEGDFESERRRAAESAHEQLLPYEDASLDKPVFPDSTSGLTHP